MVTELFPISEVNGSNPCVKKFISIAKSFITYSEKDCHTKQPFIEGEVIC